MPNQLHPYDGTQHSTRAKPWTEHGAESLGKVGKGRKPVSGMIVNDTVNTNIVGVPFYGAYLPFRRRDPSLPRQTATPDADPPCKQ